jgi:hypothetical protein
MGGGQHAADPSTQQKASAGAEAQAQAAARLSDTYNQEQKQNYSKLFGDPNNSNSTGTLTKFLDPNSLNVSSPTGPYALQYKQATGNLAQQTQAQRGMMRADLANRGFGANSPSGMGQDAELQLGLGQNAQQGSLFTQAATNSYNDALNNFWNATNIAAGQAATSQAGALGANQTAAGTYTNLYNTASQPYQSGGIANALIGGGAQVGAAAMCPCAGSKILMFDSTYKFVEELRRGDKVMAIDGTYCLVLRDPLPVVQNTVEVVAGDVKTKVSATHTFQLSNGGYAFAVESEGMEVAVLDDVAEIERVRELGREAVYPIEINGNHTYCVDGFWSMS